MPENEAHAWADVSYASSLAILGTALPDKSQLYGDPDGKTFGVLHKLFAEMAGLFDDDVFNIGADETSAKGPCSVNSTFSIFSSGATFSIFSSGGFMTLGCSGGTYQICW